MKSKRVYTLGSVFVLFFLVLGFALINPGANSKVSEAGNVSTDLSKANSMSLLPELAESMGQQNSEYHISENGGALSAHTPSHGTSVKFDNNGITVSQKDVGDISMSLSGSDKVEPIKSSDSKVEYQRGNVTEWYINSPLGLEQGFTLQSRTDEIKKNNKIEVRIDLETSEAIEITQSEDRKSLDFVNSENDTVLRYGKLYAFDSKGTELSSRMNLTDNGIVIEVNDKDAVYPVVIDPIFETQKITANDAGNKDHFGRSVHIDGEYAVVGSPYDNIDIVCNVEVDNCPVSHNGNRDQGSAYVFKRMGPSDWQQVAKLTADDGASYDYFGFDVGISGRLIIVGSPYDNIDPCDVEPLVCENGHSGNNKDQGSAYLFFMNEQGEWVQITKLLASDGARYDNFGKSVHIDGTTAVVGSPNDNVEVVCNKDAVCSDDPSESNRDQGSAYIYEEENQIIFTANAVLPPVLFETQKIVAEDGERYDRFGYSVSIYGQTIVVGAPDDNIEIVCPEGLVCDLGSDESYRDQGSAYVFDKLLVGPPEPVGAEVYFIPWVQIQKLVAEDGFKYDHFGTSVDIFQQTIVIGSPDDNVHFCEDSGDDNTNTGNDVVCTDSFDGHKDQGSAYVFEQLVFITEGMYINPWQQTQKLIAFDGYAYDHYGFSVGIYDDKILVGSPYDNIHLCEADPTNFNCVDSFEGNKDQGSAYLYQFMPDWGFEFVNKLLASDGYAYDRFGKDVSLTESFAISGAPDANLIFNDPKRVCEREVTEDFEVENTTEITEENINEDTEENTAQDKCGPKDQGAAYIYDIKLIFEPLDPGIDNQLNLASGNNATPNGKVAIIYGFKTGNFVYNGNPCTGIELGIKPPKLMGMGNANPDGTFSFPVFVPPLDDLQAIYLQAVDIASCTTSAVQYQIILNN